MRVIAGIAKGHQLKFPRGTTTRPATDLVRGAVFSILENTDGSWLQVLDLFSGSGAMGIEALSRGAGWVDFVDRERRCCAIIEENLHATKLADRAKVHCLDVEKALSLLDKEYGIVVMDPPYPKKNIGKVITKLAESRLIGDESVVIVTHSTHLSFEDNYSSLHLSREYRHGDSCIALYQKEGTAS
ncbi:16S rRNA (guanine(966)-N(2))-methyltransferase RsmD [Chloroflexota bacterium]